MSINTVSISGYITADSKKNETNSGSAVLTFSVAVNELRKNSAGEWEDYPNFIDCAIFGKRAETFSQYLKKGTKVSVSGHLRQSRWEKDGQKRSKINVVVDEIEYLSHKKEQQAEHEQEPIPFD